MKSAIAFSLHISNSRTKPAGLYFLYQRKLVDATLGFYIRDFICKEFKTYNLALFLRGISIKMPANVIIKKGTNSISYSSIYNCYTTAYLNFLFVLTQPPNCHLRSLFCLPKDCFHQQHRRPRSKRAHQCHINCEVSRQERDQTYKI